MHKKSNNQNNDKNYRPIFDVKQRIKFLKQITQANEDKIEITEVDGLLVDFVDDNDIDFMVYLNNSHNFCLDQRNQNILGFRQ